MTDRTTLALAACEGLPDAELAERGAQGFKKMIERKRKYAAAFRMTSAAGVAVVQELKKATAKAEELQAKLDKANATIAALQAMDTPVSDTTQAADMLKNLGKKGAQ